MSWFSHSQWPVSGGHSAPKRPPRRRLVQGAPAPGPRLRPSKRRPTLGRPPLGLHRVPMPKRWYPRSGIQRLGSCVSPGEHWGRGALRESPGRPPSAAGRGRERVVSPTPHKAKGLACSKHPRSSRYRIRPLSLYHELFLALYPASQVVHQATG